MNPKERADSVLSILDITRKEQIDVDAISHFFGINVVKRKLEGCSARLACSQSSARITISNAEKYEPRIRFSIAHELGHFFLHKNQKTYFSCSSDDMFVWDKFNIEVEANNFAANLLMPQTIFKNSIIRHKPSINLIIQTSNDFTTSLTATLIRYVECSPEPLALIYAHNGKVSWTKRNKDFAYFLKSKGESVHEHSYAHDCFKSRKGNREGKVPTYAWIDDRKVDEDAMIYEIAFYSPTMNASQSLLWVDEDIERAYSN